MLIWSSHATSRRLRSLFHCSLSPLLIIAPRASFLYTPSRYFFLFSAFSNLHPLKSAPSWLPHSFLTAVFLNSTLSWLRPCSTLCKCFTLRIVVQGTNEITSSDHSITTHGQYSNNTLWVILELSTTVPSLQQRTFVYKVVQRCGTVRLTGASNGANLTMQELFNTELAPAEYQIIPALLG